MKISRVILCHAVAWLAQTELYRQEVLCSDWSTDLKTHRERERDSDRKNPEQEFAEIFGIRRTCGDDERLVRFEPKRPKHAISIQIWWKKPLKSTITKTHAYIHTRTKHTKFIITSYQKQEIEREKRIHKQTKCEETKKKSELISLYKHTTRIRERLVYGICLIVINVLKDLCPIISCLIVMNDEKFRTTNESQGMLFV